MTTRIAVDWGTSSLRLWALDESGAPSAERRSDQGMGRLTPDQFEDMFLALADGLLGDQTQVLICGMAGAKGGWSEAGYRPVPADLTAPDATRVPTRTLQMDVRILGGLSQAEPADVMRGEETQIAGFLAGEPDFDGTLCLPGTHTKWVQVSGGKVQGFRTVLTGELFAALSTHTVLRTSVTSGGALDQNAFLDAVQSAFDHPEDLTADLFALRANGLLHGQSPEVAKSRLSGALIGQELAAMRPALAAQPVTIIGDDHLTALYKSALKHVGTSAQTLSGSDLSLRGICAAFDPVFDTKG